MTLLERRRQQHFRAKAEREGDLEMASSSALYQREWRKKNPESVKASRKRFKERHPEIVQGYSSLRGKNKVDREKFPEKWRARYTLDKAIRRGEIVRPTSCSRCGWIGRIEGHHKDYSKPLEVTWLCHICHMAEHPRKKVAMSPEGRTQIANLAAWFVEDTNDIMALADMIESVVARKLELIEARKQKVSARMEESEWDSRANTR